MVLRHAHRCVIDRCYFSGSGMRVYGTKHLIQNSQLVNDANILLDNKSGSSYVVAQDVKVNYIYYDKVETPVTNRGKNCSVTNIIKEFKITKNDLLNPSKNLPVNPSEPVIEIIPYKVDSLKLYKLNLNMTTQQIQYLIENLNSLKL